MQPSQQWRQKGVRLYKHNFRFMLWKFIIFYNYDIKKRYNTTEATRSISRLNNKKDMKYFFLFKIVNYRRESST